MNTRSATQPSNRQGTLGTSRDWRHRLLLHHLPLALVSAALFVLFMWVASVSPSTPLDMTDSSALPREAAGMNHSGSQAQGSDPGGGGGRGLMSRATTASGYVATVLLALTLLIGPANLLLRRPNPVSSPLARDVGTWAFTGSVVHVVLGFQVHGNAENIFNFLLYFTTSDGVPKFNSFGLGNWTGLVALIIVAGLLALSNDRSLRELKAKRWKNLQRTNYALFGFVLLHAFFYGALLRTTSPFTFLLISTVIAVFAGQMIGIWLYRRKRARSGNVHADGRFVSATDTQEEQHADSQ